MGKSINGDLWEAHVASLTASCLGDGQRHATMLKLQRRSGETAAFTRAALSLMGSVRQRDIDKFTDFYSRNPGHVQDDASQWGAPYRIHLQPGMGYLLCGPEADVAWAPPSGPLELFFGAKRERI